MSATTAARPATPAARGLYGSNPGANIAAAAAAEFIGTFLLVLAITATACAGTEGIAAVGASYNSGAMPLVNGLALAALAVGFGHVSGAHFNPAVTLALAVTRRFPWMSVAPYVIAQFAGGVVAALATWAMFGERARTTAHLGATGAAPGVSTTTVFSVEAVITFLLMTVVIAATTDDRAPRAAAPLAVGFALAAGVFIAAPLTGAGVNPARALGPMFVAGATGGWWAFLIGPVVGAVLAAVVYDRFIGKAEAPS